MARSGETQQARNILEQLGASPGTPPLDIAMILLGLEQWDEALEWLSRACEQRAAPLHQFAVDPRTIAFAPTSVDKQFALP